MEVKNLTDFINRVISILEITDKSGDILFRKTFRENLSKSLKEAIPRLKELSVNKTVQNPYKASERMIAAGLTGFQLELKLESFQYSLVELFYEGGIENLEVVLAKSETILNSLAGAIPGFGSFAQELIGFIIQELRRKLRFKKI